MIKVAFVIGRLNVGGAEAELIRLARGLDRSRFAPFVVTLQEAGKLARDLGDVELVELGRRRKWCPTTYAALRRVLRERKPDIVQSFLFTENIFCRRIGQGIVVSGLQGSLSDDAETGPSLKLTFERATFDRAAAVISNSEYYRSLYGRLGFDTRKIRVIRSGTAPVAASGSGIRAQFGIRDDEVLITCVARLVERKGHDDLIRAGAGYRLLFVGDGPYARHLTGRGAVLAGPRRDVPEILAASDIVALASRFGEGCPNAVLEAMAAGKPVVAARSGGTPEVVVDGVTGLLVPPQDIDALQAALRTLAADPAKRRAMGAAGLARAELEFGVERLVRAYETAYCELTAARASD
ncbi:MAG: glycosyltransferase [Planctomycetota bacterium]|nr:MAG: glycosyltransferase [Planctomycetota bacterium]